MRPWGFAVALAVVALARTALPADAPEPPIGMITPGGPHYECGREWATPIAFRELMSNIEDWIGRCVRVRGITRGHYFYGDLPDYYRATNSDPEIKKSRGPALGMYAKDAALEERLFRYRQEVEVVAMAYTCRRLGEWSQKSIDRQKTEEERLKALKPDDDSITERIVFLTGYCHYTSDPVLFVSEVRVIDKGPVRLEGVEAGAEHGDLEPLLATDPEYAAVWPRLVAWFDALRRRDGAELLKLTADAKPEDLTDKDGWLYELLDKRKSGARFLFSRRALPPMLLLKAKKSEEFLGIGCLCKSADCEGRWPIHSADAAIVAEWPYACMWVWKRNGKYEVSG